MGGDRITELTIEGMRSIARLTLPLRGLTVLIGENGAGKSTIVEACEILRRVPRGQFPDELNQIHGGTFSLLRHGASELRLGVRVEGDGSDPALRYAITIGSAGPGFGQITGERLEIRVADGEGWSPLFERRGNAVSLTHGGGPPTTYHPAQPFLINYPPPEPVSAFTRMRLALDRIEVHLPFEVFPAWAARDHKRESVLRGRMRLQAVDGLTRLGSNLANAYYTLRIEHGEEHWQTTMDYVRLGLGDRVESVNTRVDAGGGAIAVWIKMRNREEQIPAEALSDGMLAYLAFVALYRLRRERSLLAFDEPDLHLHPALLARVAGFFAEMADDAPVVLTTHSDRLLDTLADPAAAVRVCEIEEPDDATRVRALDGEALEAWLDVYRGVGELRSAGYLSSVLKPEEPA
jgi:predicted ATPase